MTARPAALIGALVLALFPVGAAAAEPDDAIAALPESAWAQSITVLDRNVTVLVSNVTVFVPNVSPLDTRTTQGDQTVISLASDILFDFGKADVGAAAEARIGELVAEVPQGAAVQVHGHTDSISDRAFNQTLSEQRAQTVAGAITQHRPDLQLEVAGFGMDQPVEPNEVNGEDNPEGRALNRRVEIRFSG